MGYAAHQWAEQHTTGRTVTTLALNTDQQLGRILRGVVAGYIISGSGEVAKPNRSSILRLEQPSFICYSTLLAYTQLLNTYSVLAHGLAGIVIMNQ